LARVAVLQGEADMLKATGACSFYVLEPVLKRLDAPLQQQRLTI